MRDFGGLDAHWFKELLTGKSIPEIIHERNAEKIYEGIAKELDEGFNQALNTVSTADLIEGSAKVKGTLVKSRLLAESHPSNEKFKELQEAALSMWRILLSDVAFSDKAIKERSRWLTGRQWEKPD